MDRDGRVVYDKLKLFGNHRCSDASYWPLRSELGKKEGARISEDLGHQICIFIHRMWALTKGRNYLSPQLSISILGYTAEVDEGLEHVAVQR